MRASFRSVRVMSFLLEVECVTTDIILDLLCSSVEYSLP